MPTIPVIGYAAKRSSTRLKPLRFKRESAGPGQVEVEVLFCDICHTDIDMASLQYDTPNA